MTDATDQAAAFPPWSRRDPDLSEMSDELAVTTVETPPDSGVNAFLNQYGAELFGPDTPPAEAPPIDADPTPGAPPEVTPEPTSQSTTPPATPPQATPQGVIASAKAKYGIDLGQKYADDEKALDGLLNAYSMVGQRNEKAMLGERLLTAEGRQEVAAWLQDQHPEFFQRQDDEPAAEIPVDADGFPLDALEYLAPKENMPAAVRAKVKAYIEDRTVSKLPAYQRLRAELEQLKAQVGQVAQKPDALYQTFQQQNLAQQQQMAVNSIVQQNAKKWFQYNNDGAPIGLTPEGHAYKQALDEASAMQIPTLAAAVKYADAIVASRRPATSPPPNVTPGMTHIPSTRTAPNAARMEDAKPKDGESFGDFYRRAEKLRQAAEAA